MRSTHRLVGRVITAIVGAVTVQILMVVGSVAVAAPLAGLPPSYQPPSPPQATLTDLGSPMNSLTVVEGDFGTLPDGTLAAYAAPMGENSALNVSSTTFPGATTQLAQAAMRGASGAPTITVAPNGTVYLGTFYQGQLFAWDPTTQQMTNLGAPVAGETYLYGLSAAPDGTIYGGTYPSAHAFAYHPDRGFTDLGRVSTTEAVQYAKSTVYDPDTHSLYVGTQPVPELKKIDLDTGAITTIPLSAKQGATSIIDLDYASGRVFANLGGVLRVVDTSTDTEVAFTEDDPAQEASDFAVSARGVSEERLGKVYWSSTSAGKVNVVSYDLATDSIHLTGQVATRGALIGYGWATENGHDVLYAFAGNYSGGGFRYDIQANTSSSMQFSITPTPSPLQHVLPSKDGKTVYINAFLNGNGVAYDVANRSTTPITRLGQVEDWVLDEQGTVQAGVYPTGAVLAWDPSAGATSPAKTYAELKNTDAQIRPIEVKTHRGLVYYGTEPDYGLHGGALVVVDPATGSVRVSHDIVAQQTLSALEFVGDRLLVGSSREGGTGTEPVPGSAHIVEVDPATGAVLRDVVPVAGAESVTALSVSPQGYLMALVDNRLVELDPRDLSVRRSLALPVSAGAASGAGTGELWFHRNGYLSVSVADRIMVVDPLAFQATEISHGTHRLELASDGSLWTLLRPTGFTNFLNVGHLVPAATACGTADTREFVTVRGVQTAVRNRFVITGCTIQDLIPQQGKGNRPYAGVLNPWLDEQVNHKILTAAEADLIRRAAKA